MSNCGCNAGRENKPRKTGRRLTLLDQFVRQELAQKGPQVPKQKPLPKPAANKLKRVAAERFAAERNRIQRIHAATRIQAGRRAQLNRLKAARLKAARAAQVQPGSNSSSEEVIRVERVKPVKASPQAVRELLNYGCQRGSCMGQYRKIRGDNTLPYDRAPYVCRKCGDVPVKLKKQKWAGCNTPPAHLNPACVFLPTLKQPARKPAAKRPSPAPSPSVAPAPAPKKRKPRCPKGSRRNKAGDCISNTTGKIVAG